MTIEADNDKRLELAITAIEKNIGKGSIIYNDTTPLPGIDFISSGSIKLDLALGGGYGRGRVIEIYGNESSGKTTLALEAIVRAQKQGLRCAFIDMEHALDIRYAKNLGVDLEHLVISQPDYGEQAFDIIEALIESSAVGLIVLDSVAALVPKAELEGEMEDQNMGLQARMMSKALRKLNGKVSKANTALLFINQIRMKIGIVYGNPETTTSGNALKFYASQRLEVRKGKAVEGADELSAAIRTKAKVVKNKLFPPFREAEFEIEFGRGINKEKELIELASDTGIIDKSGSWYAYKEQRLGQGVDNVIKLLQSRPELMAQIIGETLTVVGKK